MTSPPRAPDSRLVPVGAAAVLLVSWLLAGAQPLPVGTHGLSPMAWLRVGVGIPGVLLLPGLLLVPWVLGREALHEDEAGSSSALHPVWWLAGGVPLSILSQGLHVTALRILGLDPSPRWLLAITAIECVALGWLWVRRRVQVGSGSTQALALAGLGGATVLALTLTASQGAPAMDPSFYLFEEELLAGLPLEGAHLPEDVQYSGPFAAEPGPMQPSSAMPLSIENTTPMPREAWLLFASHGPREHRLALTRADEAPLQSTIPRLEGRWDEYGDWGLEVAGTHLLLSPGERVDLLLTVHGGGPGIEGFDLNHARAETARDAVAGCGLGMMPFNSFGAGVAEARRLTDALSHRDGIDGFLVLPDRLANPPGFSHWATAVALIQSPWAPALALNTILLLLLWIVACCTALSDDTGRDQALLALGLGGVAAAMLRSADLGDAMIFPDATFALGLAMAAVTVVAGRPRTFVAWAAVAALSRMPGGVVAGSIVLGALLLAGPEKRRTSLQALGGLLAAGAVIGGFLLVLGVVFGEFEEWMKTFSHELVTEHFEQNPDPMPAAARAGKFLRNWTAVGALTALMLIPARGRMSRVALAGLLFYTPTLLFIDHFAYHYQLPLILLLGVAVAGNLSEIKSRAGRIVAVLVWVVLSTELSCPSCLDGVPGG